MAGSHRRCVASQQVAVVTGGAGAIDEVLHDQALKRRLTPADTATAVAFLASESAAAMTGQVLCVDGGVVLR